MRYFDFSIRFFDFSIRFFDFSISKDYRSHCNVIGAAPRLLKSKKRIEKNKNRWIEESKNQKSINRIDESTRKFGSTMFFFGSLTTNWMWRASGDLYVHRCVSAAFTLPLSGEGINMINVLSVLTERLPSGKCTRYCHAFQSFSRQQTTRTYLNAPMAGVLF